jgi:hypothetical protein
MFVNSFIVQLKEVEKKRISNRALELQEEATIVYDALGVYLNSFGRSRVGM